MLTNSHLHVDFHLRSHSHSHPKPPPHTALCIEEQVLSLHTWKGGLADTRIKNSKAAGLPGGCGPGAPGNPALLLQQVYSARALLALAFSDGL